MSGHFLQSQEVELTRLLELAKDNPVVAKQLRNRLSAAKNELAKTHPGELFPPETPELPRAAIFLRCEGVNDSHGISPSLAAETLLRYEQMFIQQAIHDEREAAQKAGRQRRRRGAPKPGLVFTGTPRGSFGFEFVPHFDNTDALAIHKGSLEKISNALVRAVSETDSGRAIDGVPEQVLAPLKQFLSTLAFHDAGLRLAFSDKPSQSVEASAIRLAADRLERDVKVDSIEIAGTFRGVTRESGFFDIKLNDDTTITGHVSDEFTEEDLEQVHALTNHQCKAVLRKTTITRVTSQPTETFVLLKAERVTRLLP